MFGQTNHNGVRYYRHAHAHRDRKCTGAEAKAWIPADAIEDKVMCHLFETFGNPSAVKRAIEAATPKDDRIKEAQMRLETVSNDLAKIEASRQRILGLVVNGTISETSSTAQLEKLKERETRLQAERARLEDELAHLPSSEAVKGVSKSIATRFRSYTNARAIAKGRHANEAFDEMTYQEKRELCQSVFNGTTAEGKRMGVWIRWNETGKKWSYDIEGHLISDSGPMTEGELAFVAAHKQKRKVTKFASH